MASHIGRLIRDRRLLAGMSQQRLAAKLCDVSGHPTVTRHEICRWERGGRIPQEWWLRWISDALEVPMSDLLVARELSRSSRKAEQIPIGAVLTFGFYSMGNYLVYVIRRGSEHCASPASPPTPLDGFARYEHRGAMGRT